MAESLRGVRVKSGTVRVVLSSPHSVEGVNDSVTATPSTFISIKVISF